MGRTAHQHDCDDQAARDRQAWQPACKLILNRADAEAITRQLSLALFMDAKLDLGHKRARAKTPA